MGRVALHEIHSYLLFSDYQAALPKETETLPESAADALASL